MSNAVAIQENPEVTTYKVTRREAQMFAISPLVPQHLRQGGPEVAEANCFIALHLAKAMNENPMVVLQNIHIVNGKAGFSSQYMIARANASGVFKGRINWRINRSNPQNLTVTAFAVLADTGEVVEATVDMAMAQAEGWTKNPKYKTMAEVMLRYRSAAFLVRWYCPDVMLGYHTVEEVEDVAVVPSAPAITAADIIAQAQAKQEDAPQQPEPQTIDAQPEPKDAPHPQPPAPDVPVMDYEEAVATLGMAETVIDLNSARDRLEGFTWSLDERAGIDEVYNDRLRELKKPRR